jgi:hypothetical protein
LERDWNWTANLRPAQAAGLSLSEHSMVARTPGNSAPNSPNAVRPTH